MDDLDHSDAEERPIAKDMHKIWSAVVRNIQVLHMVYCLGFPAGLSSPVTCAMRRRCACDRSFRPLQRMSIGLRPLQRRGAYHARGRSSNIPTLITGVIISVTSMSLSLSIASLYASASSVGG